MQKGRGMEEGGREDDGLVRAALERRWESKDHRSPTLCGAIDFSITADYA